MLFLSAVVAALAGLAAAVPTPTTKEPSAVEKRASYASADGTLFNIDGTTAYYAGTNSYWISFLTDNADVDLVMGHLQTAGLKILRVWGFNDVTSSTSGVWFQSFISGQQPQINTGANGLQRLDYVVSSAEAHDIKLIINFVNNWSDYGGMAAYTTYYGGSATDWYTNSKIQAQYQAYIKAVVSRYTTSTAVFAWELANEPRCSGCPSSTIFNWAQTTSKYIKSLDPNHMVGIGDEGFMASGGDGSYPYTQAAGGYDFVENLGISTLDFGTLHLYPDSWSQADSWGNDWISNHAAACVKAGKPCLVEEYGTTSNKATDEGQWQATALSATGMGGDCFWQDGDTLSTGQSPDDGYTIFYGTSDWTALVTDHIASIKAKYPSSGGASAAPPSPTTAVASSAAATAPAETTAAGSVATAPHYGQCGGTGWTGPTVCASGFTCTESSQYYSQCL